MQMAFQADTPDELLLMQMGLGNEDALRELHRRYSRLLYGLGRKMLRDADDVDICVQDAFMNAWRHASRFDAGRASAKTWLVTIAHRRFLQQLRDRPETGLELEDWDAPTHAPDPVDTVLAGQAVQVLSSEQRQLVELAYYQGHSHAELATLTGLPLGTVKSRLRLALDRMRAAIGQAPSSLKGGELL